MSMSASTESKFALRNEKNANSTQCHFFDKTSHFYDKSLLMALPATSLILPATKIAPSCLTLSRGFTNTVSMYAHRQKKSIAKDKAMASPKMDEHLRPQVFADTGDIAVFCGSPPASACGKSLVEWHQLIYVFSDTKCFLGRETGPGACNETRLLEENHLYAMAASASYSIRCEKGWILILFVSLNGLCDGSLFENPFRDLGSLSSLAQNNSNLVLLPGIIFQYCNVGKGGIAPYKGLILESARVILKDVSEAVKTLSTLHQCPGCLNQKQFNTIDSYIRKNLKTNPDSSTLARLISRSKSHFIRLFKNTMKMPVMEYRRRIRIHKAMELLISGHYDIAEVVVSLGFCDHRQLIRLCKKYFNATPRQIQNRRAVVGK
jgi:AraC-like DNA-binding protein